MTTIAVRHAVVGSGVGLHARPAALIVSAARDDPAHRIALSLGDQTVDAASIIGILTLGADLGAEIVVTVEGPDAERVADEFAAMIGRELDA